MLAAYWRIVIRANLGKILLIGVASVLVTFAEIVSIGLVIPVVALFSGGESPKGRQFVSALETAAHSLGLSVTPTKLLLLALAGMALFIVLKSVLALGLNYVTAFFSQDTKKTLTARMFMAYEHARYAEHVRRKRGEIVQDIQGPPDTIGYVVFYLGQLIAAFLQLFLTLIFLAWLSLPLTVVVGALGLFGMYVFRHYFQERAAELGRADYAMAQASTGLLVDALDGVRIVKIHNLADRLRGRLEKILTARRDITVRLLMFQQLPKIFFEVVGVLIVVLLISLAQTVPAWGLDFPFLAAFVLALRQITPAASNINSHLINMAQQGRQIQVIDEALTNLPQEKDASLAQPVPDVVHALGLETVTFAYPDRPDKEVILNLSLTFTMGKVTALVGGTGAGKSTITDLIIRLQEPNGGRLTANGIDIRNFALTSWREQIGYVGQDVFLFNATLRENIAALDDRVPMADIVRAAQLAQVHEFIATLPHGYETQVGDRGVKLSGGQRQRIAVARAILKRPKVLILDEATSALDALTERALHSAIAFMRHEAIVILIAHRLSTVEDADEILVLENGRVVEQGRHDVLLARQGLYWRLYRTPSEAHPVKEESLHVPGEQV